MTDPSHQVVPPPDENDPTVNKDGALELLNRHQSEEPGNASEPAVQGKKLNQYLAAIYATLGSLAAGAVLAWTSPALPVLQSEESNLHVTSEEGSWISSLVAIGAVGGALPAGYFAERFGRKLILLSLSAPFLLSYIIIIFAKCVELLYIARLIAGIAIGAVCVVTPMYVCEIAETSIRGAVASLFEVSMTIGVLFTFVFGAVVDYTWLAILSCTIPIIFFVTFSRVPESPVYLMKKYRHDDAKKSLLYFRGPNYDVRKELEEIERSLVETSQKKTHIKDLVSSLASRKALTISLGLMIFQQLCGVNAVIFYTEDIFKSAGSTLDPKIAAIVVGLVEVIAVYVSTVAVDRAGRRILLLISASVMTISLTVLGFYFNLKNRGDDVSGIGWLPSICVNVYIVVFSLGFGPIPWMIMGEIFAPNIKETASSLAVCTNWTLVFVVTYTFEKLVHNFGEHNTFWLFAVLSGVATGFVFYLVPETKGKSLSEIQDHLNGNVSSQKKEIP